MKKFRNYAFVMGVCAAVIGAIVAIGNAFDFVVNEVAITSVITALIGVLVSMGIIVKDPEDKTIEISQNEDENENIIAPEEDKNTQD